MTKIKNKRGQIAIWVIVALIIVAIIIFILFVSRQKPESIDSISDPKKLIRECTKEGIQEAIDIMLPQGGFVEPENYKTYKNIKIAYLCENIGYFKTCINQHPLLIEEMEKEIDEYAKPKIEACFADLEREREKRGEEIQLGAMKTNISLASNKVYYNIQREVTISKNSEKRSYDDFNIEIESPAYDLANVASDIVNQEAKYCYFEYVGYMLLYPKLDISKFTLSDSTKIYTIKDKETDKEMNIAIRGCAIPPGI